ncbi:MAG: heparinase II/III family protein [Rhodobacteraceae bacterium]|nr:heparinase II/III family protein [Paracoccaceae bacterium]
MNRWHARRTARGAQVTAFVSSPEPRTIGSFARGRQMVAGNYLFAGHLIEAKGTSVWDVTAPTDSYLDELHGFAWLDDLASVGDYSTRELAQDWLWGWIDRYGAGTGPGWTPDLTGRRLIRWINHAIFVMRGQEQDASEAFFKSLGHQTKFLSRRWQSTEPGLPRFEALTGLIYAALALEGMGGLATPAIEALARECETQIDDQGGLPTRNPEELLSVFMLLTWATAALSDVGQTTPRAHTEAIARIAPTLRTLRHADGTLARFHGGGKGQDGWLDHALAASGVKARQADGLAMGFARLSGGRTSIILDAAQPPRGKASTGAHAGTLAFELTSGRRALIVNCGSGSSFGTEWRRAGRATPSHSTLCLDGYSSSRLTPDEREGNEPLADGPTHVPIQISQVPDGLRFEGGHNGYLESHGLTHARTIELTFDGRGMAGEDMLLALEPEDKRQFDKAMDRAQLAGIPYDIRFHLHPEVDVALDMAGNAVSMALKSGEIWIFRQDGNHKLDLQPSVYLERGRLKPRATQQIVLSGRAMEHATRVRWSLSKAQDTAIGIRDLRQDEIDLSAET